MLGALERLSSRQRGSCSQGLSQQLVGEVDQGALATGESRERGRERGEDARFWGWGLVIAAVREGCWLALFGHWLCLPQDHSLGRGRAQEGILSGGSSMGKAQEPGRSWGSESGLEGS